MTNIELELLTDREMIDFFIEKGTMRGGISTVCRKKESIANNKYMCNYDPNKESSYIMYYDVTNLYGFTMTEKLPVNNFQWLSLEEINYFQNNINELFKYINSDTGYILEVDLIYPISLKNKHIELPLAPQHYDNKLTPNLFSKYNYRLRFENLKFYIDNGMILQRIIKGIKFYQTNWLQPYINLNTELRKNTTDESAKNFYKLMNNAVYGKTMENVFNRKKFHIITNNDIKKAERLLRNPRYKKEHMVSENLVIVEMEKDVIEFDKPIYIGFSILELSKLHMYNLHYNVIKKHFDNSILMYMVYFSFS